MKFLVIGASGLVGNHVLRLACEHGHDAVGTFFESPVEGLVPLSLEDERACREVLEEAMPDTLVCCGAWVWTDGCEQDPERAAVVNHRGPASLARACAELGIRFVFVSSNYVFDGSSGPYDEESLPAPINSYGASKLAAETEIRALGGDHLIIRTCGVYGAEAQGKNFLYQVLRKLSQRQHMLVPTDQIANATNAVDLAWGIIRLVEESESGIWNLAGPDPDLSRIELARRIARAHGLDENLLVGVPTCDLGQAALRPLLAGLVIRKAAHRIGFSPKDNFNISLLQNVAGGGAVTK